MHPYIRDSPHVNLFIRICFCDSLSSPRLSIEHETNSTRSFVTNKNVTISLPGFLRICSAVATVRLDASNIKIVWQLRKTNDASSGQGDICNSTLLYVAYVRTLLYTYYYCTCRRVRDDAHPAALRAA
ncbi:hypothetical protein PUN28_001286 [Cardiocondyla obscurior]|uniref:Uncharacterized protein n=1 Tax=Cardiocondyla obscurior TaxID=286306 RepID=A0AAW2H4K6_9HYME